MSIENDVKRGIGKAVQVGNIPDAKLHGNARGSRNVDAGDRVAPGRQSDSAVPCWKPATRHGYHALTYGFLVGVVVRRIAGTSVGALLREEVAGPLGADCHISVPESAEAQVAPFLPPAGMESGCGAAG